ncbi:anti-sigma factor [Pseudoduganella chitinolytica]|uniref:Anti-sigma factor n=1 Tax=Pseudoduganella chitinolytica TaxID=34070 RepID=A0ABY8B899_9BURK|nr:anti-sigma factor [Pseudoduganella chitinolytica]WEF31263.1 anti-sigma factor [Pseudoduganella chitinolytica]
MSIRDNPELRDRLAAEYVLGTLKGGARRRFEGWLHGDAALRRLVQEWSERLVPLGEFTPERAPRARVWRTIEQRLHLEPPPKRWQLWHRDPLHWWRTLGLTGTAATAALALVLVLQRPATQVDTVATLTDERAQAALVVTADHRNGVIAVRVLGQTAVPDERTLQLWAITQQGTPRSLGILDDKGSAQLLLNERALGSDVAMLAVSLEPKGGSPNPNAPTGPVLYKGSWVRLL